jgi:hypothetical protein
MNFRDQNQAINYILDCWENGRTKMFFIATAVVEINSTVVTKPLIYVCIEQTAANIEAVAAVHLLNNLFKYVTVIPNDVPVAGIVTNNTVWSFK